MDIMILVTGIIRNRVRSKFNSAIVLVLSVIPIAPSFGQQVGQASDILQDGKVANYRFAGDGELTITIGLVGAVRMPGRYELSRSVDMLDLLALAGGWSELADLGDIKINRLVGRGEKGLRQTVSLNLTSFQDIQRTYLTLQDGDYVYVGTKTGITTQEVISYITAVAVLVTTYLTIANRR